MDIILLVVGKTSVPFVKSGIDEYISRLKRYTSFHIEIVNDVKTGKGASEQVIKEKEGEAILQSLQPSDYVVLLDEHGEMLDSVAFANRLQKIMNSGRKRLVFIVGGPYGFSADVYTRAEAKISLSKMTFTHEMVRLFFVEQVYRAMTILKGEPYHHV